MNIFVLIKFYAQEYIVLAETVHAALTSLYIRTKQAAVVHQPKKIAGSSPAMTYFKILRREAQSIKYK